MERVTREQCKFFRALYEDGERRSQQLEGRAKVYLSIASALLAAMILKAAGAKNLVESLRVRWTRFLPEALPMIFKRFSPAFRARRCRRLR